MKLKFRDIEYNVMRDMLLNDMSYRGDKASIIKTKELYYDYNKIGGTSVARELVCNHSYMAYQESRDRQTKY